jgi:3-deoxy-D-manno-octulosonate 8-phosphate phosphatase (KDO 8-P phosphatase)
MQQAEAIKLLVLDVDGTLTNGIIYYGSDNIEMRGFHVHDGMGLKLLRKSGVEVAVISAKKSELVARRLAHLKIEHAHLGFEEKVPAYEDLKQTFNLKDSEIAYMGDDLTDLAILQRCGFAITLPDAPEIIKQHSDYITQKKPGKGAVREVCELIMQSQNTYEGVIQSYL